MDSKECKLHKLVADVFVQAENRVLLVRYRDVGKYDGEEGWFLPDDYLAFSEHPVTAAQRILREQLGLDAGDVALGYIESFGGKDGGAWHLIFHHRIEFDRIPGLAPSENLKAAEWFPLDHLPDPSTMAHGGWANDVIAEMLRPAAGP